MSSRINLLATSHYLATASFAGGLSPLVSAVGCCPLPAKLANVSGNSTPPMSFMTCIIGGRVRAMLCSQLAVALVPFCAVAFPDHHLVELDVRDRLGRGLDQVVEVFEHQHLEGLLARRRRPR